MAERLAGAGFPLGVFDTRPEAMELAGATAATTVRELAGRVRTLVLVVATDKQLEAVVEEALAARPLPGLLIVHATVHPRTVRDLGARCAQQGVLFLDAPVTGGSAAARNGVLTCFAGGDAAALEASRPVLAAYCRRIEHVGELGAGQTSKIINNAMSIINTMVGIEVERIIEGLGMDFESVRLGIVAGGTGGSRALAGTDAEGFGTPWSSRRRMLDIVPGQVRSGIGAKDVGHALSLAKEAGVETPVITAAVATLQALDELSRKQNS
jgi:3-hydroxyisobutyrate dehydrogenase-like beta-hydroxyacid dehydrogenase